MTTGAQLGSPIVLDGSLHDTIWGGQRLATVAGKRIPEGGRVGESWETAVESVARNVPYAGQTLGALVERHGADLLGWRAVEVFGPRFPLLAKFIDAHDQLSVQVHPDDAYAAAHEGGKLGKTETWYVLGVEPGAQLVYGLRRPAAPDEVRAAIAASRLEDLLYTIEARAGDVIFVPAGTVHAIGAGVCLYELQEYSDITYRLYDYGRLQADGTPRELHVERALEVMRYTPGTSPRVTPVALEAGAGARAHRVLVACRYFVLEEIAVQGTYAAATDRASCQIVSVVEGACVLATPGASGEVRLGTGDTAVLPAVLGPYSLSSDSVRVVRSYVPTEDDEALRLWQAGQDSATSE